MGIRFTEPPPAHTVGDRVLIRLADSMRLHAGRVRHISADWRGRTIYTVRTDAAGGEYDVRGDRIQAERRARQ